MDTSHHMKIFIVLCTFSFINYFQLDIHHS